MKHAMRWFLLVCMVFAVVQSAAAYSISSISISPSGALTPGTTVTVSFSVQFAASGDETFPSASTFDLYTDLDNPSWTADLVLNDISNPQPLATKKNVYLTGWILSYDPDDVEETLEVTLTGTVPSVTATSDKIIVRVQELDSRNNVVSNSVITETRKVINTAEVSGLITSTASDLAAFRAEIDEKAALDVDTSTAEQKYSAAQSAINTAKSYPSSQYDSALTSINNAKSMITDGKKLLDRAWAEKEVANAQEPLAQADAVISWLKPNATTGDAKVTLTEITTKREIAAGFIVTANDQITTGNYEYARQKAGEAFSKANETYNDAKDLQKQMRSGFQLKIPGGTTLIIAIVVIVIIAAVGYVIYRKRSQWDELG